MAVTYVERFRQGTWSKVPAIEVNGNTVVVTGNWLKTATLDAEECSEGELEDPQKYIDTLKAYRSHGLAADIFTFGQKLPATTPKYSYPVEPESVAAIRMTTFSNWWDKLPQEGRKNARRAAKRGVIVRIQEVDDDLVRGIVAINDETPIRQGKEFTHFGESFDKVRTDFMSFRNRSDLVCAYCGDELIGLIKIVYCGEIAAIMKLQTKVSHKDKRPANALLARAIERCHENGASYVTYGQYRYGNQAWTSLMEFKARHGFEEHMVPRYYVPLTVKGKVSTSLKLHRGIVGLLPPRAVQIGRSLRAGWKKSGLLAGVAQR